jgi:hypothetical protein
MMEDEWIIIKHTAGMTRERKKILSNQGNTFPRATSSTTNPTWLY